MRSCVLVVALSLAICVRAVTRDQFYPYGTGLDQRLPKGADVPAPEYKLQVPIIFYGQLYDSIFVNNFGVLTFRADIPSFMNAEFPLPYPSIAAFYSNIDTSESGTVFYRESHDPLVIRRAEDIVQSNFNRYYDFHPTSVFIATWIEVSYPNSDRKNSFQIAVISNGTESFVEFLYPEREIQWIQREVQQWGTPDAKAQAGFIADDGRIFTLRGSGTHQVRNIVLWSNTHEPGKYIFRVGNIPIDSNIVVPDQYNETEAEVEEESKTCALSGPSVCHTHARCVDYQAGICCQCDDGYYGNGKTCIKNDAPLRVHGKINGVINDIPLDNVDIQAYVVVADGKSYTAISQGPPVLGNSLQLLSVLGGVIGWLFAKPFGTAKNGYQLTGALFNHTAHITFPRSGDRITINQEYLGHDVFDQITLEVDIRGTLPTIPPNTKLDIHEYVEHYNIIEPGLIRTDSSRTFIDKRTGQEYVENIDQTFTYSPCRNAPPSEEDMIPSTLTVGKNYLGFESRDNIIRYGMSNRIAPLGKEDPCKQGRDKCGSHSTCVTQGESFTCVCQPGYTNSYIGGICEDVNECVAGTHNCDSNADCYNTDGDFQCVCRAGFEGNGVRCAPISKCKEVKCDSNAQCIESYGAEPTCVCNPGFEGDGHNCWPAAYVSCGNCSAYATCSFNEHTRTYRCACNRGFVGDGTSCVPDYRPYTPSSRSNNNRTWPSYSTPPPQPSYTYPPPQPSYTYPPSEPSRTYPPPQPTYTNPQPSYTSPQPEPSYTYPPPQPSYTYPSPQPSYTYPTPQPSYNYPPEPPYTNPSPQPETTTPPRTPEQPSPTNYYTSPTPPTTSEAEYNDTFVLPECNFFSCECPAGYSSFRDERGNDLCRLDRVEPPPLPPENVLPECNFFSCECPAGYSSYRDEKGNDLCRLDHAQQPPPENDTSLSMPCKTDAECPPNAECVYSGPYGIGHCACPEGYEGDGYECIERTGATCASCSVYAHCRETANGEMICVCNTGYHGDGYICRPNFSCTNNSDCEYNAECKPDPTNGENVCQCVEGFIKDQNDACVPDKQLCNGAVCAEHASCLFDYVLNVNYCSCDAGYEGNGIYQCVEQGTSCDVSNDCHPDAVCTPTDTTYQCICNEGFIGNGYNCNPEPTCRNFPAMCDVHASCLKGNDGYVCECNTGYSGNGSYCELNPRRSGNFLVATDGATVYKVPFVSLPRDMATPIYSAVYQIAVSIDVDCLTGTIYWGDVNGNSIKRIAYDGTGQKTFLSYDVKAPEGISIDWSSRNMFWADSRKLTIEVANLDTLARKVLFSKEGINNPRGIVVHPQRGKIFWSDWNRINPKIEWANMDGTERGVFLDSSDVKLPNSLAIDWARDRLCYADAGLFTIVCVGIDNRDKEIIASNCSYPFGLAIHGDKFYWSDWKSLKVEFVDKATSQRGRLPIATASRRLYGVAVAPDQCPPISSYCELRNGNCSPSQLCLPNSYGRSCVDPDVQPQR